ncbi:F-box domain protein [Zalerion maritima]|uniref:F-box domain protein n=1 Tax=Zalerion maritima TaxID=339359 RepID=A0AAD5RK64_9PEZI|nr:F-box domain protein [Zalerion maritima]
MVKSFRDGRGFLWVMTEPAKLTQSTVNAEGMDTWGMTSMERPTRNRSNPSQRPQRRPRFQTLGMGRVNELLVSLCFKLTRTRHRSPKTSPSDPNQAVTPSLYPIPQPQLEPRFEPAPFPLRKPLSPVPSFPLLDLPPELVVHVSTFLDHITHTHFHLACRTLRELCPPPALSVPELLCLEFTSSFCRRKKLFACSQCKRLRHRSEFATSMKMGKYNKGTGRLRARRFCVECGLMIRWRPARGDAAEALALGEDGCQWKMREAKDDNVALDGRRRLQREERQRKSRNTVSIEIDETAPAVAGPSSPRPVDPGYEIKPYSLHAPGSEIHWKGVTWTVRSSPVRHEKWSGAGHNPRPGGSSVERAKGCRKCSQGNCKILSLRQAELAQGRRELERYYHRRQAGWWKRPRRGPIP